MTSAGKRMSIRIDRNALEQFLKEKAPGMKQKALVAQIGISENGFSRTKGQGHLALENLARMSKFFGITMWNLPFVNDEAYTISFKLTTDLDLHLRAKMIDQIRGLLASGIPQDKVRDIVLSDILAGKYTRGIQNDSESKACLATTPVLVKPDPSSVVIDIDETTPNGVQNKRLYVENASDHESSEISEINRLRSELSEAKSRISDTGDYTARTERSAARSLAKEIVEYLEPCSEDRPRLMVNIIKIHERWIVARAWCEYLHISVKKRPLLETAYFFIANSTLSTSYDAKYADDIRFRLYEEVELIGRYPIKTNTDTDDEACEKEEETEND